MALGSLVKTPRIEASFASRSCPVLAMTFTSLLLISFRGRAPQPRFRCKAGDVTPPGICARQLAAAVFVPTGMAEMNVVWLKAVR
jgi:hypothetical protein